MAVMSFFAEFVIGKLAYSVTPALAIKVNNLHVKSCYNGSLEDGASSLKNIAEGKILDIKLSSFPLV
ncbi:hypothetical protein CCACVL1_25190 [Corchorus capsularis]|uniref:Uncharacterized protein n=1 Tax=Corchorus capsularis TaxID=210143 RepID=A0A1R3GLL8_COCAP|nr:hypothetical protein CCACVL1_25190 [Corchorus capsularis]